MPDALQMLNAVVATDATGGEEYRWVDLLAAMQAVISVPPTWEAERMLLAVLRFEGMRVPVARISRPRIELQRADELALSALAVAVEVELHDAERDVGVGR